MDVLACRKEDEEALCAVCSGGLSAAPNYIVFCERCDVAVHQNCYGIAEIPRGAWSSIPHVHKLTPLGKMHRRPAHTHVTALLELSSWSSSRLLDCRHT